jgi:hypothetical protein
MNMKMLGFRSFQIFTVVVACYIGYYNFYIEEHLFSMTVATAKYYGRIYGFAWLWMSLVFIYSLYKQISVTAEPSVERKEGQ